MKRKLRIWLFKDGKLGHEKQTLGLIQALKEFFDVDTTTYQTSTSTYKKIKRLLCATSQKANKPDLILGAGHQTHIPMLAARLKTRTRIVVLMKPSLPKSWFDLVVVPKHDNIEPHSGIFITNGAITDQRLSTCQQINRGLVLLGGPSKHYEWNTISITEQIKTIATGGKDIVWTVTNSRRTPNTTLPAIASLCLSNVSVKDHKNTGANWLQHTLAKSATVWVSEDSISMIYESLSSGAKIGLLTVPRTTHNKLSKNIDQLIDDGWLTAYSAWCGGAPLTTAPEPLDEARRLAEWMNDSWL